MEEKVKEIISKIVNKDLKKMNEEDISPNQIEEWDSLHHLHIITALEEEFDIEIDPDNIMAMIEGYKTIIRVLFSLGVR